MAGKFLVRSRLAADERGATIVEFAFVAPVLCLTLFGLFDLGYQSYVSSIVQGALHEAARMATIGDKTGEEIDEHVEDRLEEFSEGAEIVVTKKSYSEFSDVKLAEPITEDTMPKGKYNFGDCFRDISPNGKYDDDRGKDGLGQSEDVVYYKVAMTYPRLFPFPKLIGLSPEQTVVGVTVLRNQPYASRTTTLPEPICPKS